MSNSHVVQIAVLAGADVQGDRYSMTEVQLLEFARMIDSGSAAVIVLADNLEQRGLKPVLRTG